MVCVFTVVAFAAGEWLGISILAKFEVNFLHKHCWLKQISALQDSSFLFIFSYWWTKPQLAFIIFSLFILAVYIRKYN